MHICHRAQFTTAVLRDRTSNPAGLMFLLHLHSLLPCFTLYRSLDAHARVILNEVAATDALACSLQAAALICHAVARRHGSRGLASSPVRMLWPSVA